MSESGDSNLSEVNVYWIPLGAGAALPTVRWSGRLFEAVTARLAGRVRSDLYHAALEVRLDGVRYVIEMGPAWGHGRGESGVVGRGPVGMSWLGRSRFFRYEVRRWPDGIIPDIADAVGGPRCVTRDEVIASRMLKLVPDFPMKTWGRDELRTGDMWNSNSLVAWLLAQSGVDTDTLRPPGGGRAPGWKAGLAIAARQDSSLR